MWTYNILASCWKGNHRSFRVDHSIAETNALGIFPVSMIMLMIMLMMVFVGTVTAVVTQTNASSSILVIMVNQKEATMNNDPRWNISWGPKKISYWSLL